MTDETASATALHEYHVANIRRNHANSIAHALFDEIRHLIPRELESAVRRELWEAVYRNGTMLINDREAEKLGLERKDADGWTSSERVKMIDERHRLSQIALMHPMFLKGQDDNG